MRHIESRRPQSRVAFLMERSEPQPLWAQPRRACTHQRNKAHELACVLLGLHIRLVGEALQFCGLLGCAGFWRYTSKLCHVGPFWPPWGLRVVGMHWWRTTSLIVVGDGNVDEEWLQNMERFLFRCLMFAGSLLWLSVVLFWRCCWTVCVDCWLRRLWAWRGCRGTADGSMC
jgi:hypothetical protein